MALGEGVCHELMGSQDEAGMQSWDFRPWRVSGKSKAELQGVDWLPRQELGCGEGRDLGVLKDPKVKRNPVMRAGA